jgi:hypothetical protein
MYHQYLRGETKNLLLFVRYTVDVITAIVAFKLYYNRISLQFIRYVHDFWCNYDCVEFHFTWVQNPGIDAASPVQKQSNCHTNSYEKKVFEGFNE